MDWKRTYISLKRRRSNILLFFILLCTLLLFIISSVICQASQKNILEIERTYGSTFKIEMFRDETNPDLWEQRTLPDGTGYKAYMGPYINKSMLEQISEVEGMQTYEAGNDWEVLLLGYELTHGAYYEYYKNLEAHPEEVTDVSAEDYKNMAYIAYTYPVRNSQNHSAFYNGSLRLTEGQHITEKDTYKVLVSEKLAETNQLKVGDKIRLNGLSLYMGGGYPAVSIGKVEAEIAGLFEPTYHQAVSEYTREEDILDNWLFIDSRTGMELDTIYEEKDRLREATFFVENPREIDDAIKAVKNLDEIDWKYFTLEKDDSSYSSAVKPLRTMRTIMMVFMGIFAAAGVCLLALMITHSVKKRTREVGILMSVGLNNKEIRKQLIIEYFIIGIAAYVCAAVIGTFVVPAVGDQVYQSINKETAQKVYTEEEIEAAIARGESGKVKEMAKNQQTEIQASDHIEAKADILVLLGIFVCEMVVLYFCVSRAIKRTMKLEPIQVLSMIE